MQGELAEARGVPVWLLSIGFLALVAVAVAESAQIVGVLLVFTLMVGPAAAALEFLAQPWRRNCAVDRDWRSAQAWGGVALAYYSDWPASFWITALSGAVYLASLLAK